jgi:hypothetical protein
MIAFLARAEESALVVQALHGSRGHRLTLAIEEPPWTYRRNYPRYDFSPLLGARGGGVTGR